MSHPNPHAITIIDDFFSDPHDVRAAALHAQYHTPPSQHGRTKNGPIARRAQIPRSIKQEAEEKLQRFLNSTIQSSVIEFRYTTQDTIKHNVCHSDGSHFAGIVYLSREQDCCGGTSFFRHKATSHFFDHRPARNPYEYSNPGAWDRVHTVGMKFNRLAFYPGKLFHAAAAPFFGETINNARLTLNIFINVSNADECDSFLRSSIGL